MTTCANTFHLRVPGRRTQSITRPASARLGVQTHVIFPLRERQFSAGWLILTLGLATLLAMPATAFDFLGDVMATRAQKWLPPVGAILPPACPSEDYIYDLDNDAVACRVHYGAPGLGAYTELCSVDLFDGAEACEAESSVLDTPLLAANLLQNAIYDRMLTRAPASETLNQMGFVGALRLTATHVNLNIQDTTDFYLTDGSVEHRIHRGGKAVLWHEDPDLGLVLLAAYDINWLDLVLNYDTGESFLEVSAVRTEGLPNFPEIWTGELLGGGDFVNGLVFGDFPGRLEMELLQVNAVQAPTLAGIGMLFVVGLLAIVGWTTASSGTSPSCPGFREACRSDGGVQGRLDS
jgi:hypothetical protein